MFLHLNSFSIARRIVSAMDTSDLISVLFLKAHIRFFFGWIASLAFRGHHDDIVDGEPMTEAPIGCAATKASTGISLPVFTTFKGSWPIHGEKKRVAGIVNSNRLKSTLKFLFTCLLLPMDTCTPTVHTVIATEPAAAEAYRWLPDGCTVTPDMRYAVFRLSRRKNCPQSGD